MLVMNEELLFLQPSRASRATFRRTSLRRKEDLIFCRLDLGGIIGNLLEVFSSLAFSREDLDPGIAMVGRRLVTPPENLQAPPMRCVTVY